LFFEHSAAQLRQLRGVYRNCTSTPSSNDPDGNGQCYVMPKLQKLLGVLKKYGNSKYTGENYFNASFLNPCQYKFKSPFFSNVVEKVLDC